MSAAAGRQAIGVAMPARDAALYIGAALESVLRQSVAPAEIVVVDDGSTDATARIAASFGAPVRVISQPPAGPAAARNRAIGALSTDLVALLDADDLWPAHSLAVRRDALARDAQAELCFGRMVNFVSPDLSVEEQRRLRADTAPQRAWASSAMLCRGVVFERYGQLPEHRRARAPSAHAHGRAADGCRWQH